MNNNEYKKFSTNQFHYDSNGNMIDKIYRVLVTIDEETRFEHYGKDANEMNNQYLVALDMCQN